MAVFQYYLQSGNQKSGMGGERQSSRFWSKIPYWKWKCEMVRCCDATPSYFVAKVRGEVFANFHAVAVRRKSNMRNWLFLTCYDELFVSNLLHMKENDEHALDFSLHLSCLFRFWFRFRVWTFRVRLMPSSPNACLIIAKISVPCLPRFAQSLVLFLCRILREILSGQIHNSTKKGRTNQQVHPAA
jgi:hypothetical protein